MALAAGATASAQSAPVSTPARTLVRPTLTVRSKGASDYKDVSAKGATVTAPSLRADMSTSPAVTVVAWLYFPFRVEDGGDSHAVTLMPPDRGSPTRGSYVWVTAAGAPAGHYHVRFTFQHINGTTGTTNVSIHSGGTPSDPVVATCTLSSSVQSCDAILSTAGGAFAVTASVDSGAALLFDSVYLVPAVPTEG